MTGTDKTQASTRTGAPDDPVETLLRQAALRERPAPGRERAMRERLRGEWRELVAQRRRRRGMFVAALAASVALAFVAVLRMQPEPLSTMAAPVATIERVTGQFTATVADAGSTRLLAPGDVLRPGQSIAGADGSGLSLRWLDGSSVRIDQGSVLALTAAGEMRLEAGRVYVDTEAVRFDPQVPVVLTPAGRVRHLGTRYLVAVGPSSTQVSVRDGRVEFEREQTAIEVDTGERLSVDASGYSRVDTVAVFGPEWDWTERLAAPFDLDGRTLAEFLEWVSGETGLAVEYDDPMAAVTARSTELRGSIDLPPRQALDLVLQTSDLIAEVNYGIIRVSPR